MTKYIFLDTNNWIYLSNGFNIYSSKHDELHLKIFNIICKRVKDGSIVFLVNDIILSEWERNKNQVENQINEISTKFKGYNGYLKAINEFINEDNENEEIIKLKIVLEEKYHEKIKRHKDHIKKVEDFLKNNTLKINISDKNKIEASDLALEKKAPFIGDKKNSMADALILLNSIEYIYENKRILAPRYLTYEKEEYIFPESFFVSSNKGDFSDSNDKEKIHKDLEPFLNRTNTKFYYTLGKLINSLEERFLTEEEETVIEHVDESAYCDVCDFEHYPTVEFSEYFQIINPNKKPRDKNQLLLEFPGYDYSLEANEKLSFTMLNIRTATCSHCRAEYIECSCGEINHIKDYNSKFECAGCGNKFQVFADIDRKGMIHSLEYELLKDVKCEKCGDYFGAVDDVGLCEYCAEYERIIND